MTAIRRFLHRLATLFRSNRAEAELAREVDAHLRLLEDGFVASGMSAEEARLAARRAFGGVEQAKEEHRSERTFRWLAGWPMDLRLGARMLGKSPGLTAVAVFALSVAIGGGAAYLEVVNDLFRPSLAMKDGDRLVAIEDWNVAQDRAEDRALRDFATWRESARSLEHLGVHLPFERNLITEDGRSEPVAGVEISTSAFRLFPTPPIHGRLLGPEDEKPGAPPVALIGHHLWQRRFGADPGIVGRTIRLGKTSHTVVGVMPEGFGFPVNHSLWIPLRLTGREFARGEGPAVRVFGRLAPGISHESGQAELAAIAAQVHLLPPGATPPLRPRVRPYLESRWSSQESDQQARVILYSLNLFFVGLLAICGANVATLVFARTATREGEIALRAALGASRGRIVAQLFAEALVLASLAAAVGLALAYLGIQAATDWVTQRGIQTPFWWNSNLAPGTVLYTVLLTIFTAAIIGVVPARKATGPQMQARLKHAAGGMPGMSLGGIWTAIIVGQVGVTVVFLLTVVSLAWNVSAGGWTGRLAFSFPTAQYLSGRLEMDRETAEETSADADQPFRSRFLAAYGSVERRLEAEPGVAGVTYAANLPGTGHSEFWLELDGIPPATRPTDGPLWVRSTSVAADYFQTMEAAVVAGRTFTAQEVERELPVAVVDDRFARMLFGARNPIGQRVRHPQNAENPQPGPWLEIVGVVKSLASIEQETTEDAVLYRPTGPGGAVPVQLVVRVKGDATAWTSKLLTLATATDPSLRLYEFRPVEEMYRSEMVVHDALAKGLAVVGGVALLLATAGVYSLLSFTLARRTREIGIRAALGASPRRIITGIFSRAFMQVGIGVLAGAIPGGVLVAVGAPEVARGGGAGVAAVAAAAVGGLIVTIALGACVVPARRALRVHPSEALRGE